MVLKLRLTSDIILSILRTYEYLDSRSWLTSVSSSFRIRYFKLAAFSRISICALNCLWCNTSRTLIKVHKKFLLIIKLRIFDRLTFRDVFNFSRVNAVFIEMNAFKTYQNEKIYHRVTYSLSLERIIKLRLQLFSCIFGNNRIEFLLVNSVRFVP